MALALSEMLIGDRKEFFAGTAPNVVSSVLWRFVAETEHKNVAYDVFDYFHGSYAWRIFGLDYATGHIFWHSLSMRWRLAKLSVKLIGRTTPRWFRIWQPKHQPSRLQEDYPVFST